jgi:hypothetical protein
MGPGVRREMRAAVLGVVLAGMVPALAAAQAPATTPASAPLRARQQQIATMEGILRGSVQNGVNRLRQRVSAIMPGDALLQAGPPQVRGFLLEGFGVFFDVEVPALQQSTAWMLQAMTQNNALLARELAQLRQALGAIDDPQARLVAERALQNVQRQIGPVGPAPQVFERQAPQLANVPVPGTVGAQSVVLPADAAPAAASVDPQLLRDPDLAYTQEVKNALLDAMIVYGGPLALGPDEWLTIAARDNAPVNPLVQSDTDFRTIMFRIKGSDLLEFQMQRLTLEQVKARVTVQEF